MSKWKYKFIALELGLITGMPKEDYREIISKEAAEGWRFVQLVSNVIQNKNSYELIFEKENKE